MAETFAFFSTAYTSIDSTMSSFLGEKLSDVISIVRGPPAVGMAIYLVFVGYAVLRGLVDEPWREWLYRMCKLALVWAAITSSGYNDWISKPLAVDAPNAITQAIAGNASSNVGTTFDDYFNRSDYVVIRLKTYANTFAPVNPYKLIIWIAAILVWVLAGLSAIAGFAVALFAKVALTVVISLGPIFIALSIFNATRGIFYGFLNQAFNYILLIGIIAAITGLIISLGDSAAQAAAAQTDPVFGSIIFDIYVVLGTVFFLQAPSIAAGIAGGAAAGIADFTRQTLGLGHGVGTLGRTSARTARMTARAARTMDRAARSLRDRVTGSNSISA